MGLIFAACEGLIVGALARLFTKGDDSMGLLKTMLLGFAGAMVAGLLGRTVGWYTPGQGAGIIASVLGAMLVLWIYKKMNSPASGTA